MSTEERTIPIRGTHDRDVVFACTLPNLLAIERIMEISTNVIDPPLEVVSGTRVDVSCIAQPLVVIHDGVTLNPRRASPDVQRALTFMKPKQTTLISTFNLRTGKDIWRIQELIFHMKNQNISIIGLQEHRRVHEDKDEVKFERIDGHILVTTSAWRNSRQAAVGGVGFLINPYAEKSLCDVVKISDRIIKASFA